MTFRISWSTPSGRFGWTEITECVDLDDALDHFDTHVRGLDAPADVTIDEIKSC